MPASVDLPEPIELAAMVIQTSAAAVAADYGCSRQTVHQRLIDAGYSPRALAKARRAGSTDPSTTFRWDDQPWVADAICNQTDPEAFFPEKGGSTKQAKAVCNNCDVRLKCLDWAMRLPEQFGIWGGLSEKERRTLRRRQAQELVS